MQFAVWTEALKPTDIAVGTKLESNRAGNHTAFYFPVRRNNKPIRFYTPIMKCKFAPNDEYNTIDVSQYAPFSGNPEHMASFIDSIKGIEEFAIQWCMANREAVFSDFEPVPTEEDIRFAFRSCLVDRFEGVKLRLPPDNGCAYFTKDGTPMTPDDVRTAFKTKNLPNVRLAAEIKSIGVYNGTKRKGARVPFAEGKIELRMFVVQARVYPADEADGREVPSDVCLVPDDDDMDQP